MGYAALTHTARTLPGTTPAIDTSGADLLVAVVSGFDTAVLVGQLTDSKSNTWSILTVRQSGGLQYKNAIFYSRPTSVGSGHTFTYTAGATYSSFCVAAFSGSVASPFDVENGIHDASGTTVQSGSITPSEDNCLVVAGICAGNLINSIDGGFTILENQPWVSSVNMGSGLAYLIQTSTAAANPTWTLNASAAATASIASFKAVAGSSRPPSLTTLGMG